MGSRARKPGFTVSQPLAGCEHFGQSLSRPGPQCVHLQNEWWQIGWLRGFDELVQAKGLELQLALGNVLSFFLF